MGFFFLVVFGCFRVTIQPEQHIQKYPPQRTQRKSGSPFSVSSVSSVAKEILRFLSLRRAVTKQQKLSSFYEPFFRRCNQRRMPHANTTNSAIHTRLAATNVINAPTLCINTLPNDSNASFTGSKKLRSMALRRA